jgi:FKBP-type peptidyl-prolyl cis-trans isomerase FkpA
MKKLLLSMIGISLIIVSCNRKSNYPGFSLNKNNIYFRLEKIGESETKIKPGDFITADIEYRTISDSVFFKGRRKFQVSQPEFKGSVDECITTIGLNDAATFIISGSDFFHKTLKASLPKFINEGSNMKIRIEVVEVQSKDEYLKEKQAFINWTDDFDKYEKVILKQFIEGKNLQIKPTASGLYFIPLKDGKGKNVQLGDTVVVQYEGKFLNGKFFDSTIKRKEAFQFVYGQQWQVIKGLEEAIGMMKAGEKALCILPSGLAFGHEGSSTGIIPPFTSVIFEVELEAIKN